MVFPIGDDNTGLQPTPGSVYLTLRPSMFMHGGFIAGLLLIKPFALGRY